MGWEHTYYKSTIIYGVQFFFISKHLTQTEINYSTIEKEVLAVVWACERFADYLIGTSFSIESDHSPLVNIFTSKNIEDLSA